MEKKLCRYKIRIFKGYVKTSYLEAAAYLNSCFLELCELDAIFKEMIYVGKKEDIRLFYPDSAMSDVNMGNVIYGEHKYWLNRMRPNSFHDIYYKDHYGIPLIIHTVGLPLENIKFTLDLGPESNVVFVEFPRDFERDFEWYKKILSVMINVFKPDYGGLYPVVMVKHEPPPVTGGWVSYFASKFKLGCNVFDGCVEIPVLDNEFMYAVEDNHMIQKNEVQFNKLGVLIERFKKLSIQL